jgi:hypothetical protein
MAHQIEEYAKHCGVKIGKPIFAEHFIPVKHEKYYTIDTSNSSPAAQYPYWTEFVALLRRSIPKDVAIIRIGHPSDTRNYGEDSSFFELTVKQLIYVIKGSSCHFTIGGASSHIASAFNIPQVSVQSNYLHEYVGPVWSDKVVNIQADLPNGKPSFSAQEEKPVIFSVWPNKMVDAGHKLLPDQIMPCQEKITHMGKLYCHYLFEVVPDFWQPLAALQGKVINVRYDLHPDLGNLERWLQSNPCSLVTKEAIPLDLARKYRKSIAFINFFNESGSFPPLDYLHDLKTAGIQFSLFSEEQDSESYRRDMNKYFDFQLKRVDAPTEWPDGITDKTRFRTNKVIFTKDGQFGSRAHVKLLDRDNLVIKDLDFLREIDHFYLYE